MTTPAPLACVGGLPLRVSTPIPGLGPSGRAALEDVPALLRARLDAGAKPTSLVLHVQCDSVAVEDRAELAAYLRRNRVGRIARKIERAIVPPGALLVFVDCDETDCVLMPLSVLLGPLTRGASNA